MDLRSDPPLRLYQFLHSRIINSASRVYHKSYYAFLAIPSDLHMSHPLILPTDGSPHTHSTHRHHIHSASPCPLLSHAICIRVPTFSPNALACPVLLATSLHTTTLRPQIHDEKVTATLLQLRDSWNTRSGRNPPSPHHHRHNSITPSHLQCRIIAPTQT